jgi:hypothetical protein
MNSDKLRYSMSLIDHARLRVKEEVMNQKIALLNYLKRNKGITTWVAMDQLGIARLSERIRELESDGHKIGRESLHGEGRYGNPVRVTKYRLIKEKK